MYIHRSVFVLVAAASHVLSQVVSLTDPDSIQSSSATCATVDKKSGEHKDIRIRYVEFNPDAGRTLLFVHGWPGLWHVWKHQIEHFKEGYHLLLPNLRGFPGSDHPGDLETAHTMGDLVADLVCVLEHAKVSKVACVGHDWGSQVCYEAARLRPDIFEAVIGICIPYLPYAGPFVPIDHLVPAFPKLAYNLHFQGRTKKAVKELSRDVRRTLRATLRTVDSPPPEQFLEQTDSYLRGWDSVPVIPPIPFFTPAEEDFWVKEFEQSGFRHTLGFYTHGSRYGSWEQAQAQGNFSVLSPALSILATQDPVADWVSAAEALGSAKFVPELTTKTVPAAHWLQLEKPGEVNEYMKEWLDQYYPASLSFSQGTHVKDEL